MFRKLFQKFVAWLEESDEPTLKANVIKVAVAGAAVFGVKVTGHGYEELVLGAGFVIEAVLVWANRQAVSPAKYTVGHSPAGHVSPGVDGTSVVLGTPATVEDAATVSGVRSLAGGIGNDVPPLG